MAYRYPTTSPSTSVIAMSVSGVTSPSMLKAVRASRTATLKEVHPRYASLPMRPARLSPTRCQNSTTPSAPAFSIMSSIREARATSIIEHLRAWPSHERTEDLFQVRAPFFLRLRGDRVPFDLPEAIQEDRQEPLPMRGGHVWRRRPDLVVGHRDDLLERAGSHEGAELGLEELGDLLVFLEFLRLPELLDEQDPSESLQFPRDDLVVRGEDLRGDGLGLEQMADDDRGLHDVREDGLHLRDLDRFRREEDQEGPVSDPRDDDRARLELLDGHHHVLPAELAADMGQTALQEIEQAVLAGIELVRDRGGEDPTIDPEEHGDVREVDRQEDVLPDRLAGLRVLLDGAQDDAEFLQGVEQLADQLALLELVRGRPDDRGHRVDHDALGDD